MNSVIVFWRRLTRGLQIIVHLSVGLILSGVVIYPVMKITIDGGQRIRDTLAAWWFRRVLRIFNVKITAAGTINASPTLFVANHSSWLDIFVLGSCVTASFVSKAEIRNWPVAGWLCLAADTLFIKRGNRNSAQQIIEMIAHKLSSGRSIFLFPEGGITKDDSVGPFRRRLFEAALTSKTSVQAIALCYMQGQRPHPAVKYNDINIIVSTIKLLGEKEIDLRITFCQTQDKTAYHDAMTPKQLADITWEQVKTTVDATYT